MRVVQATFVGIGSKGYEAGKVYLLNLKARPWWKFWRAYDIEVQRICQYNPRAKTQNVERSNWHYYLDIEEFLYFWAEITPVGYAMRTYKARMKKIREEKK